MHITTILGSPRKQGNTARVLTALEDRLRGENDYIDRINVTQYTLKGCIGCGRCRESLDHPGCVLKDDMMEVFERMLCADLLLYASPLYVYGFSAQIKPLLDRQCCLVKLVGETGQQHRFSLLEGKSAALLVTCADGIEGNADLISVVFERECRFLKCSLLGTYIVPNCTQPAFISEKADRMAERIFQDIQHMRETS